MKQRIITAIVATCVLLPVLIFSETPLLPFAMGVCSVICVYEMARCIGMKKAYALTFPLYAVALAVPFLVRYIGTPGDEASLALSLKLVVVIGITVLMYFLAVLTFSHGKYKLADICILYVTALYIILGFNGIGVLRIHRHHGALAYLTIFFCAWVTDTFAYFCGMLFGRGGKHKLIPDVSPKKTVEGAVGGVISCVLFMIIYGYICNCIIAVSAEVTLLDVLKNYVTGQNVSASLVNFAIAGFLASIVAQVGDLVMSVIKRTYGIKDYGKLFPGHGGMVDRFDSVLSVSIAFLAYTSFFDFFA